MKKVYLHQDIWDRLSPYFSVGLSGLRELVEKVNGLVLELQNLILTLGKEDNHFYFEKSIAAYIILVTQIIAELDEDDNQISELIRFFATNGESVVSNIFFLKSMLKIL